MKYSVLLILISTFCYASSDLQLGDLKPQVSEDGTAIGLQFLVSNNGPDDASALGVRVYLYSNQTLLNTREYQIQPIVRQAERIESVRVDVPSRINRLRVEVYDTEQPDVRPSNNVAETSVQVPGASQADLEVNEGTVVTEQPVQGKNFIIRVHLVNHGPDDIVNSRATAELMVYRKTVTTLQKSAEKMASGEARDLQFLIPIPADLPSSEGLVVVRWLPADTSVEDPAPGNNTYSLAVNFVARQPDLIALNAKVDGRGELRFWVKNRGNAGAAASTTVLYLNGALAKRFNTPALSPGTQQMHQYGGTKIPSGTQITLVVDYNADVTESSEENNRLQFLAK